MKKWKAIVSIVIVFLLGALAGALMTNMVHRHRGESFMRGEPGHMREFVVRRLNRELGLDAEQQGQLRTIVQETHAEMKNLRRQLRPQTEEILARSQEKVRAILRPDQRERYEKIVAERRKKRESEENSR
jgi:hypothetical protein